MWTARGASVRGSYEKGSKRENGPKHDYEKGSNHEKGSKNYARMDGEHAGKDGAFRRTSSPEGAAQSQLLTYEEGTQSRQLTFEERPQSQLLTFEERPQSQESTFRVHHARLEGARTAVPDLV